MKKEEINYFGSLIRKMRSESGLPLRKVAAALDIDPSTLGKIEKSSRRPNERLIEEISKYFKKDLEELHIEFLSDKISSELYYEKQRFEILKAVENKLRSTTNETKKL